MNIASATKCLIICFLFAFSYGCSDSNNIDPPPVPGNGGLIEFENITHDSVRVKWSRATDSNTAQNYLEYKIVYSLTDNIDTAAKANATSRIVYVYEPIPDSNETNRIIWNQDITSINATDLEDGQRYYFNVVVRDLYWHLAAYNMNSFQTIDITNPTPGRSGYITIRDEAVIDGKVTLTLDWIKASDNNSNGAEVLQYKVLQDGEDLSDWIRDINSYTVFNLPYGILHAFLVIVRDEAGNEANYATITQKPKAGNDGNLFITNEGQTSLTINWEHAIDSQNDQEQIQYLVVWDTDRSKVANVTDENGDNIPDGDIDGYGEWKTFPADDEPHYDVSDLSAGANYHFNVLVKDIAGIETVYAPVTNAPTPGGSISFNNTTPAGTTVVWPKASDSGTDPDDLEYSVYKSTTDDIGTVEDAENGENVSNGWIKSLSTDVDLMPGTYYFNVIVRDPAGHKEQYGQKKVDILPPDASLSLPNTRSAAALSATDMQSSFDLQQDSGIEDQPFEVESPPACLTASNEQLLLWFDAGDASGNEKSSFGPLQVWTDKSGNGKHAVQEDINRAPAIIEADDFGGRPVVRFDADSNSHLVIQNINNPSSAEDSTLYVVAALREDNTLTSGESASPAFLFTSVNPTGASQGLYIDPTGEIPTLKLQESNLEYAPTLEIPTGPFVAAAFFENLEGLSPVTTLMLNTASTSFAASPSLSLGEASQLIIGAAEPYVSETAGFFNGDIAEVILFDTRLTTEEHLQIMEYLTSKWGIFVPNN